MNINTITMDRTYYTHHNHRRPFKVDISQEIVKVAKGISDPMNHYIEKYNKMILTFRNINHIFIGNSPRNKMTEFSGGYGDDYVGNSILLGFMNERVQTYIHIGYYIYTFTPYAKIVEYVSPVGNNDVPYPYAVDSLGNYYLMIEDVILLNTPTLKEDILEANNNPYEYFYDRTEIKCDEDRITVENPIIPYYNDIKEFYMDDEDGYNKYTLVYSHKMCIKETTKLYIITTTGEKKELSYDMYINIIDQYGELMSFERMKNTMIEKSF